MLQLPFQPFPSLITKQLILREITMDDAASIFAFRSDEAAMRYISRPKAESIEDAKKLISLFIDGFTNTESITWGITFPGENKVIGNIGFWRMQKEHYRAEIGYMLHPDYWKKGIMTEAIKAVLDFGFKEMKLHSVEARLTPENTGSAKVLEKSGFKKEAHFVEDHFQNGVFSDTAVYSKLCSDH